MVNWYGWPGPSAKNHRWIGVSGAGPATGSGRAGSAAGPVATCGASAAMVWCRNTSLVVSRSPACRARETTWMLRIESPPSSKKLSSTPTRSAPRTADHSRASSASTGVRGAT